MPSPQFNTVELRFQFRFAAPQPPSLLPLDSAALCFSAAGARPAAVVVDLVDRTGSGTPLSPNSPADYAPYRMLQAHRADGHHGRRPTRLDHAHRWPLPFAGVIQAFTGSDVRRRSRPGGFPRPMRRSWLRRNRLFALQHGIDCAGGLSAGNSCCKLRNATASEKAPSPCRQTKFSGARK